MTETINTVQEEAPQEELAPTEQLKLYHVRFRDGLQPKAASSKLLDLVRGDAVMVQTDHGPEPAHVCGSGIELAPLEIDKPLEVLSILRRTSNEEIARYQNLLQREQEARRYCQGLIQNLNLGMKLLQVERYFNGSKVIFYFSAETRVDFRDLVKSLVQEFRTRVEMRQIGVRHETQMLGGLGCCGRELCCGLFMKEFVPVSIKMAKEQDLPLNPSKISGVCNRLLCCLTHEYETYRALKKGMPKVGRLITFEDKQYKVTYCKTLSGTLTVVSVDDFRDTRVLSREEWEQGVSAAKGKHEPEELPSAEKPVASSAPSPKPPHPSKPQTGRTSAGRQMSGPGRHLAKGPAAESQRTGGAGQSAPEAGQSPHEGNKGHRPPSSPGKKPFTNKQAPAAKSAPNRNQAGRVNVNKGEDAKPVATTHPPRSRRSKGRRKGNTP